MIRTIAICDDDLEDGQRTLRVLRDFEKEMNDVYTITLYDGGRSLLSACHENKIQPDVIFMDIELGDMTGIEITNEINQFLPQCHIVYLTNHIQYATDVYATQHHFFVVKNELPERLFQIREKSLRLERENSECVHILLKNNEQRILEKKNISYLERQGRITHIYTTDEILESKLKLEELELLLGGTPFVRCHVSYIVSFSHIMVYKRTELTIDGNNCIPISRRYQKEVREQFMNWSKQHLF
ncbi:MAG: LytTR family DNA-binding domain-containing protein [Lachnospiraceae bacterium]|nr:LytTR family DNA-binding domain-containing protein [Lachnospiraceae bacterium]